jgi:hypothetical protein
MPSIKSQEYNSIGVYNTLRDEQRLRVCENRVLRRIFEPKREEVAEGWRRLNTKELRNLYASPLLGQSNQG